MVFGCLILLILFILTCFKPKSKIVFISSLVFMWLLYAFSTKTGDQAVYQNVYENMFSMKYFTEFEPGFTLLIIACRSINLPFMAFRAICGALFIILLGFAINKYTKCTALAAFLFLLFPFTYFMSVMRAGIACLIIVLFVDFLIKRNKHWAIFYILGVILATLFHYSSIFFFLFVFAAKKDRGMKSFMFVTFLCTVVVFFLYNLGILYNFFSIFISRGKFLDWINPNAVDEASRSNLTGIVCSVGIVVMNIVLGWFANKKAKEAQRALNHEENYIVRMSSFVKYGNILLLLTVPFLLINNVFIRFSYEMVLINILNGVNVAHYYSNARKETGHSSGTSILINSIPLLIVAVVLLVYCDLPYMNQDFSAFRVFQNNAIFGFLGW